ncbi:MAG TPA: RsmD family RNA methyltransferase [Planctomycetota bacterium]|nr:RsmD family RNA methyltransferase [Planctomycetota bacterium]
MRIITGSAKGRTLKAPPGLGTRPILDAQKQKLFDVLGARAASETGVYDVFAGSGGLGLEALSRGAARATFVERGRAALACLRDNIARCGFADAASVVPADAFRLDYGRLSHDADLVFFDPPFPLFEEAPDHLAGLLAAVVGTPRVPPGATVVWRMPEEAAATAVPRGLTEIDRREAGRSVILLYEKGPPDGD